jgi:hypothetical protein
VVGHEGRGDARSSGERKAVSTDGGQRSLFQKNLPLVHWQSIETGGTGLGVPDTNGCIGGVEFWIEFKATDGWTIGNMKAEQVAWLERRTRAGGRCFVSVRQRGMKRDDLWLLSPWAARPLLMRTTLRDLLPRDVLGHWTRGKWDWSRILGLLSK